MSVSRNLDQLLAYVDTLDFTFSVIGLSETWLSVDTKDIYSIPDYTSVHQCRQERRGGGVSLYVHNSVQFKERVDISYSNNCIECVFIEIDRKVLGCKTNVIVGTIYRPPNTDINVFSEQLNNVLSSIKNEKKLCYCMGDYNANILNSETHAGTGKFLDVMYCHSFVPLITKPTRVANDSATIIDNVFSNDLLGSDKQRQGILLTDITDHFPIFVITDYNLYDNTEQTTQKRCVNSDSVNRFKVELAGTDWSSVMNEGDAQLAYTGFTNKVMSAYETAFPVKTVKISKRPCNPWMTIGLKKSIKQKNKLYILYRKKRSTYNEIQYKLYKNRLKHLIQAAKKYYYQDLLAANKSNLKQSWRILREIIGKKGHNVCNTEFLIDGDLITDKNVIVNSFNEFFVNIGPTLAKNIPTTSSQPEQYLVGSYTNSLYLSPLNENELTNIICNLKKSAPGIDGFQPHIIKSVCSSFLKPLLYVLNLSFQQGVFPSELKAACVTPIFKGGDPLLIKNYRPVSVLPVFSKIYERAMYNRLMNYLEKNKILYEYQFGFKKNHSTYMALSILIDKIMNALDNNEHVIGLYLDFAKAFDTVDHQILLKKLQHYGIRGNALHWFDSYLSHRTQIVKYNNIISDQNVVKCGVPQGSILGPILFLLYINDLSAVSKILFTLMFADDTNMFIQGKDVNKMEECVNEEMEKVVKWLHCNKLSLNVDKTHTMIFSNNRLLNNRKMNVFIQGTLIETVYKTKFLGVIIDNNLQWKDHINYLCNKISKGIGIIKKSKRYLEQRYSTEFILYIHISLFNLL